ncbi:uncharacterized protein YjlB [Bradyrhizobium liaoningense]|nr:hypothetical protein GCM10007858_42720 [Bradyrhizobium liaoningense]
MSVVRDNAEPLAIVFEDDGLVPNNILPFLVYQGAVKLDPKHPEETIEDLFERNGWGGTWRNGVYDYLHYHATVHEVLGVARGSASVRFGGDHGRSFKSRPATSRSCRPAPGISASRRAMISA